MAVMAALGAAVGSAGVTLSLLGSGPGGSSSATEGPPLPTGIEVAPLASARAIASGFWGVDLSALGTPNATDASRLLETPARYLHFPTGFLGEELNYTSGVITDPNGTPSLASMNISEFIGICRAIHCHAILQLPAEIDAPETAAFYVHYVVDQLGFQPAFWEIGDSPSGWQHFGIPWSAWTPAQNVNITPIPFALLVETYIDAILPVDSDAHFLALGTGLGPLDFSKSWIEALAEIDGPFLSGISVHSYPLNETSLPATASGLFAALAGGESLTEQVEHDREWIRDACPSCTNLGVFVVEANAAQIPPWYPLMATFDGTLYLAADAINGLDLGLANLDWLCFQCDFPNAWEQSPSEVQSPFYLFADVLDRLGNSTLGTNVTGASPVYALATVNGSEESLLVVNLNQSHPLALNLSAAQFCSDGALSGLLWSAATPQPVVENATVAHPPLIAPLSLALFQQTTCGGPDRGIEPGSGGPRYLGTTVPGSSTRPSSTPTQGRSGRTTLRTLNCSNPPASQWGPGRWNGVVGPLNLRAPSMYDRCLTGSGGYTSPAG